MPIPQWAKQILVEVPKTETSVVTPVVVVEPRPMPDAITAEEYEAGILEDDTEVAVEPEPEDEPLDAAEASLPADVVERIREEANAELSPGGEEPEAEAEYAEEATEEEALPEPPRRNGLRRVEADVDVKALKLFVQQVMALTDEARVVMDRDGWHVKAVDPAHVAMVEVTLPHQALEQTLSWVERPTEGDAVLNEVVVGVDLMKVRDVLKGTKAERIRFEYLEGEIKDRITVAAGTTRRTMSPIDTEGMSDPKLPVLNFKREFKIPGKLLMQSIKGAGQVSDHIALTVTLNDQGDATLKLEAQGDVDVYADEYAAEIEWGPGLQEAPRSLFPLDYLEKMVKQVKDQELTLKMATDYPLWISWDGPTKGVYLLAPRIEESE